MKVKYTKELLEPLVEQSTSIAQVIRLLGLKESGGNYTYVKAKIQEFQIDNSHFTGQLWSKGKTGETDPRVIRPSITDEELFVHGRLASSRDLRKKLPKHKEYVCSDCGIFEWKGKPLTLHIDHIDGDKLNNTLDNLRYLCPNCHQQTDTWGSSKR